VVDVSLKVIMRTAFSPIVRECGDLSAGVFDPQGRMLAQAVTGTPGHVNTMAEAVSHFIAEIPLEERYPSDTYVKRSMEGHWSSARHYHGVAIVRWRSARRIFRLHGARRRRRWTRLRR